MASEKHLQSLSVRNYRGLDGLEIDRFGQVNLIVGANNAGKSSLLEAILLWGTKLHISTIRDILLSREECDFNAPERMLSATLRGANQMFMDYPAFRGCVGRDIVIASESLSVTIRVEKFPHADPLTREQELDYSIVTSGNQNKTNSQIPIICEFVQQGIPVSGTGEVVMVPLKHASTFSKQYLDNKCVYVSPNVVNAARVSTQTLWEQTFAGRTKGHVIDSLRLVENKIEDITFIGNGTIKAIPVCHITGIANPIPLHNLGDGVSRLFEIIISVVNVAGGICLIDEFENGLHWSVQEKIWDVVFKTAKMLDVQVFATTHSKDTVETFQKIALQYKEDFAGIVQMRKQGNNVIAKTIFGEDLQKIYQYDIEIR